MSLEVTVQATPEVVLVDEISILVSPEDRIMLVEPGDQGPPGPSGAGALRKHAELVGDGASTAFIISHGFNTREVLVVAYEDGATFDDAPIAVERTGLNSVTIKFPFAPLAWQFRVIVYG